MTDTAPAFPPFTQRLPMDEVWRRARIDYLAGDSAPVIAERYGLSERSVRRRAAIEGWRRCDVETDLNPPPTWNRQEKPTRTEFIARQPEYQAVADARDADAFALLFGSDPVDFRRHAYRRAADGAAMNRPAEASAWLRVVRLLDACGPAPDPVESLFAPEDHLRAAMLRALGCRPGDVDADADDDPDAFTTSQDSDLDPDA